MSAEPRTPGRQRVLFIGLDAADRELVERWCEEGVLENLSALRAKGTWASMRTTADVLHVSAWPSIFTGVGPDWHGLYHAYVMQPGEQSPARPRPEASPAPFLWKVLDDHGKRCIVVDAFLTCPIRELGGIQIVDWGSWTHFSPSTILPESMRREIRARFGAYPAEDHSQVGMTPPPDPLGFRERLLEAVKKKTELLRWLMKNQDWDLLLTVFGECHAAGHYFWHYQDASYVAHPKECDARLTNALRDVYIALDEAVGALLEQADADTTVLVSSGDGMGPNYSGSHILGALLERMRLMNDVAREETTPDDGAAARAGARGGMLSRLRGMVPKELRAMVSKHLLPRWVNEKLSLHWKTADIDWRHTRAFLIDNANEGYIRINMKGREPQGIVQDASEYGQLCDRLVETARQLTNPLNGKHAACAVHKTDDLYSGPCRAAMPDVVINWDPDARVTTQLAAPDYDVVEAREAPYGVSPYYTGNHRPNAFMIASGARVGVGRVLNDATILDLAPTIFTLLGLEPPPHLQGAVLPLAGRPAGSDRGAHARGGGQPAQ